MLVENVDEEAAVQPASGMLGSLEGYVLDRVPLVQFFCCHLFYHILTAVT